MRLCARRHAVPARRGMKAVPNEAVLVSIFYIRIDGPPKAHFTDGDNLPPTKGLSPTFTARYNTTTYDFRKDTPLDRPRFYISPHAHPISRTDVALLPLHHR